MYLVMKVVLSLVAALMLTLATSVYVQHRQEQKAHAEQQRFQREMQRAGSKNWGNSAKTIRDW